MRRVPPFLRSKWGILIAAWAVVTLIGIVIWAVLYARFGPATVEAAATGFPSEDWKFSCRITGKGTEDADENFSGPVLEGYARNRGEKYMERAYPGTRLRANVEVKGSFRVSPGRYTLYGTVVSVDVRDHSAVLTDCVFVPR